jgi:hypothetical protein
VAVRRRSANQCDDRSLFDAIEFTFTTGPGLVGKRCRKTVGVVPIGDAFHLTVVPTDSLRRREDRHAFIEMFERQDSTPRASRQLLASF